MPNNYIYRIDLHMIRDYNLTIALQPENRPKDFLVWVGQKVTVRDEDYYLYDAIIETVVGYTHVYLRIIWTTKTIES
jgi:hypothetical protein